jgi:hemerythrin-like domain-containing protein
LPNNYMMKKLITEHQEGLDFAEHLLATAEHGSDTDIEQALNTVRDYNHKELEPHLQHEEQTILAPLVLKHPEHRELCITIGKEHGLLHTLAETLGHQDARQELKTFATLLRDHTVLEDRELFPLVEQLFSSEQQQNIAAFEPLYQAPIPQHAPKPVTSTKDNAWLDAISQHYQHNDQKHGTIVLLPAYRPDAIALIAERLDFALFDFQEQVMSDYGVDADQIGLEILDQALGEYCQHCSTPGVLAHNIEALLCVKTADERQQWFEAFMQQSWDKPLWIPVTLYQADVNADNPQVCDLELTRIPR